MGHKLTLRPTAGSAGFSLIELVVVVAVLSVLAVGASLAVGARDRGPGDRRVFEQAFDRARAQSVLGRRTQGLRVTGQSLQQFQKSGETWVPAGTPRRWRGTVSMQSDLGWQGGGTGPNVIMLPNGQVSVFRLSFRARDGTMDRCRYDMQVGLTCG